MDQLEIISLGNPVETREFDHGRFELYEIGGRTIGRATYEPGWRWTEQVMGPGDLFAVPPRHDSWVVGDEPYVSLHMIGAERYARAE